MHKNLIEEYARDLRERVEGRRDVNKAFWQGPEYEAQQKATVRANREMVNARLKGPSVDEHVAASLADSLEKAIALLRRANALYLPKRLSDEITEFLNEDPRGP